MCGHAVQEDEVDELALVAQLVRGGVHRHLAIDGLERQYEHVAVQLRKVQLPEKKGQNM